LRAVERAAEEAIRRTPDLPLTRLLRAQAAQLRGDRAAARQAFQDMTEDPETRIAGLRGLYIEAEREAEHEAAYLLAEKAREESPSTAWAARALLRHQTAAADWDGALKTLTGAADGRLLDKRTARRHRAVLLAAKALDREESDPDSARHAALEAHELAPDLVPAAVVAGRLLSRQGDIRRATRVLETTWKAVPHPEIAEAYLHVRAGDAANDRLKRAETLLRTRPQADEGRLAVARAAIDARDFSRAREVLKPVLTERPTQKALMIMAELEEAETGDRGRAREWLARAVRAPRDPVWTADGVVLDHWAPASPVTGRIDTVEWKVPVAELEGPGLHIDAAELIPPPPAPEAALTPEPPETEAEPSEPPAPLAAADEAQTPVAGAPEAEPPAAPAAEPQPAPARRTNGSGGPLESGGPATAPNAPAGEAVVSGAETPPDPDAEPLLQPPLPDDPGVSEEEPPERRGRRRRAL
jgi:HemY protein